jgi:hypothetical protein
MKKLFILSVMIISSCCLFAQTMDRYVIGSAGGSFTDGVSFQVDYTVGEIVIATVGNGTNILTQGFHQPEANTLVAIAENPEDPLQAEMFPNPFVEDFSVILSHGKDHNYHVQLIDILGRVIRQENSYPGFDGKERVYFNVHDIATGTYFIRILNDEKVLMTRKAVKIDQ